jgi:large subunit ribosomal protein L23Ae
LSEATQTPSEEDARKNKLDYNSTVKFPSRWRREKTEDSMHSPQMFIQQAAIQIVCDTHEAKVNTLIGPERKKAYIQLAPDCDALAVANKIGI